LRHENPHANEPSRPPTRGVVRLVGIFVSILVVASALLAGAWWLAKQKAARDRAAWKGPILERLAQLSITNDEIRREFDELKSGPRPNFDFGWAHDQVLLMTNGEYIIFAYRHGANNGFVDHFFLGHGSNGRWLYSTYHFCNSMAMVREDEAPGSIAEFEKRYAVAEFDGKSDICLQHTWPPTQ
jgi:hypothetical protein